MRLPTLIFCCLLLAAPVMAQTPPGSPVDPAVAAQVSAARGELKQAMPGLQTTKASDAEIDQRQALLPDVRVKASAALAALTSRLQDLDARLAQLGPPPAAGQPPEGATAAAARKYLTAARAAVDSELDLTKLTLVEADQASLALIQQQRANFQARLWARNRSIVNPRLWIDLTRSLPDDVERLAAKAGDENLRLAAAFQRPGRVIVMAVGLLIAFGLAWPGRRLLDALGARRALAAPPERLSCSGLAMWLLLTATLMPMLAGQAARLAWLGAGALTPDLDTLARLAIRAVVFAALLEGLGRALLSPKRPTLRLAPLSDALVRRLAPYPGLVGAAAGLAALVASVNAALGSSLATSVAADCATLLVEMVATGGALVALASVQRAQLADAPPSLSQSPGRLPWVASVIVAWLALGGVLVAVLAGYLALATFLMRETVWIGAVLAALYLAARFVDDLFPVLVAHDSATGRAVRAATGLSDSAMEQAGVLLSGLCRLGLLALAALLILAPFGADLGDALSRFGQVSLQLHIGKVAVAPETVLGAAALFVVGLAVTRAVRSWLEVKYLPETDMDIGARTSIATAVSYVGVVVAVLLATAYLGVSFSQIALFASALSVGIGFGLQSIIGNFVSGLILLAERPVKVGDWIAIGDSEGDVKAINIRATEIEMADRSRLIVPNSDLVSKSVRNVTHPAAVGRVKIVLRVDDGADPANVRDTILKRIERHPDVLSAPAAGVYLTDVRDGALVFDAVAYVASARDAYRVKSELLFRIVPDLRAAGIALASTTPVVNVGAPVAPPAIDSPSDGAPPA